MDQIPVKLCSVCGAGLPQNAPEGLCPRCLLAHAAATEAGHGSQSQRATAPAVETVAAAFPNLEVIELIGQGGMGCVFKARQPQLNRLVALKILPEALARDPAFAARFAREAQALASLNHPNIVTVHDFGQANGFFYLLMELVDGVNLRQALRAGRFTPSQALAIVPPICDALQFAHERGIVHRDIKPENLLLEKSGRVKIADFGIAKIVGTKECGDGSGLHQTAAGTPQYMAPEQREGTGQTDHRADIYSLGVVLYELLTGEPPKDRFQPPSRKVEIDVRLDEVVLRALEREPERRYATALEFKTNLETVTAAVGTAPTAAAHGRPGMAPALAARLALGFLVAGTLGTVVLMTLSPRHDMALVFGAGALLLALVFGAMSWRERLGKAIALSVFTITIGIGIVVAVLSDALPAFADALPWPQHAARRAELEQRQRETAALDAAARQKALNERVGANTSGGSKRERFEPREGMASQTSWTVMNKPSVLNPHGWAVMARLTMGGVAKIRLPGEPQRRCEIRLLSGNDEEITVRIDDLTRNSTMKLSLARDRAGEITLDGEGFRVLYPSSHVAPNQPDASPFAKVIVTPARPEEATVTPAALDEPVNVTVAPARLGDASSRVDATEEESAASNPRALVDQWLGHVKANRMEPMWALTTRESGGAGSVDLQNTWQFDRIKAFTLALTSNAAMVVTTAYKDNAGRERRIVFSLVRRDGQWLIRDHWNVAPEVSESRLDGFITGSGARFDVRRSDIVGHWYVASLLPAYFEFREDGGFLTSYRAMSGNTNLTGSWRLQDDELNYETAGGAITGRVVNLREDYFQLEFGNGGAGYHRTEKRATTGQGARQFAPQEVTLKTNEYFSFEAGKIKQAKPRQGSVRLLHENGEAFIEIEEMHAFRLEKEKGIEQWNSKSATELVRDYQKAGFALLPSERFSRAALRTGELPLTFLLPGTGFLQVTGVNPEHSSVTLRWKLVQP